MELSTKLLFLAAFVIVMIIMGTNHKKKKKKIVFFGDSITEQGTRPGGYIAFILELLKEHGIEERYELVNAGIGGNKIYDLYMRVEHDVLLGEPAVVVLFIGVNDIWHKQKHGTGTDIENFVKFYDALVKKITASHAKLIICTPAVIGENRDAHAYEWQELADYGREIRKIAANYQVPVADLHASFNEYYSTGNLDNIDEGILTTDGVHLNVAGNKLVATELWKLLQHFLQ
jgi:lysophospholipase L1-like esterase